MKRSIYAKIYSVLQVAHSDSEYSDKDGLIDLVVASGLDVFFHSVYSPAKDEMELKQSRTSIKRAVKWAIDLGFLDAGAMMTKFGRKSTSEKEYTKHLVTVILAKLEEGGAGKIILNTTIKNALIGGLDSLPTSKYLYDAIEPSITRKHFSLYLSILQDSGVAQVSHKKLFFRFG